MNVLIIPDGNRRWARLNDLSIDEGYRAGTKALALACEALYELGETELWIVICTVNNLKRPPDQVASYLQRFLEVQQFTDLSLAYTVSPGVALLPEEYRKKYEAIATPKPNAKFTVNYMLAWSLDDELIHLVNNNRNSKQPLDRQNLIAQSDITKPIDLIIRTGNVVRLSAMIPWHSPYAELYFSEKMWPDFTRQDMHKALEHFNSQERRYGQGS
jgi:undecaprenyl diphosphate synthase